MPQTGRTIAGVTNLGSEIPVVVEGRALLELPERPTAPEPTPLLLDRDDLPSVSTEMGRDALTELCNVMANGFVDEWATLFETTIDTGSPLAVQDPERTLVARILKQ